MKNKNSLLLFFLPLLFSACSTDLDVTGKYKETMVVYGLLDQSQPKQYIKINKAFLGQGSAITMAQLKDSAQYANALTVKIIRLLNGVEYPYPEPFLLPDNTIPKDQGTFYGPDQNNVIYSCNSRALDPTTPNQTDSANFFQTNSQYKLIIKNTETGAEVSSQTVLISDFSFDSYVVSSSFTFYNPSSPNYPFAPKWKSAKNGRIHQLTIRFNYIDSTSTGTINQHLDWVFPEHRSQGLSGGESMGENFPGQEFFQFIGSRLRNSDASAQNGIIARIAGKVDLLIAVGSDDLTTFMDVSKPSTGIIQEKPDFSNITNGIGIFSSRYNKPPGNMSKPLEPTKTLPFLLNGQYTNNLKFIR